MVFSSLQVLLRNQVLATAMVLQAMKNYCRLCYVEDKHSSQRICAADPSAVVAPIHFEILLWAMLTIYEQDPYVFVPRLQHQGLQRIGEYRSMNLR